MENIVKLRKETVDKINKIDSSIVFWSVQLGQAMMRLKEVEAQVGSLYDFKKSAVLEDLKAQEIDVKDCEVTTIDAESVLVRRNAPSEPRVAPNQEK